MLCELTLGKELCKKMKTCKWFQFRNKHIITYAMQGKLMSFLSITSMSFVLLAPYEGQGFIRAFYMFGCTALLLLFHLEIMFL